MPRLSLLALAAFIPLAIPLSGCGHLRKSELRFVASPGPTSDALTFTCQSSTTGKCYFLLTGSDHHSQAAIRVGSSVTVAQLDPATEYCSGIHKLNADTCIKAPIERRRVTIETSTSSDAASN